MSVFRVTFLGTSAAAPTVRRGLSATAVRCHSDRLLVDCGEGTQRQMLRYGVGFAVDLVLFTHFHADHYLGIIGFLRTLGMTDRTEPLTLYGPAPHVHRLLRQAVHLGYRELPFPVEMKEVADGDVIERTGYRIRAVKVEHKMHALGYVLEEPPRPGRFDLEAARALGIPPGPLYGKLQRGETVEHEGREIRPDMVVGAPRPGRKAVFSGDTRPSERLVEAARGADLLVHEATFSRADQARAEETLHSTAAEAAQVARDAEVHRLVLTHLSSRYDFEPELLEREAREVFGGPVEAAEDGRVYEVPFRGE